MYGSWKGLCAVLAAVAALIASGPAAAHRWPGGPVPTRGRDVPAHVPGGPGVPADRAVPGR